MSEIVWASASCLPLVLSSIAAVARSLQGGAVAEGGDVLLAGTVGLFGILLLCVVSWVLTEMGYTDGILTFAAPSPEFGGREGPGFPGCPSDAIQDGTEACSFRRSIETSTLCIIVSFACYLVLSIGRGGKK